MTKSYMATREEALEARRWHVIDAQDKVVGRVATRVATVLRGKHKPTFTPQWTGDFVVVVNAAMWPTGTRPKKKYHHTGYPGGIRTRRAVDELRDHPDRVLREAVKGMLPKNRLGRQLATKLKIYVGSDHPHVAQQPTPLSV
jgi:large subunit ribosomal protein L13